jgi:carboxyl-terminal processing protease
MRRLLAILSLASAASPVAAQSGASSYEELQRFSAVLNHIRTNHADSVTYNGLVRAAIDGMLRSLDPHSYFVSKEDYDRLSQLERGELATTGIRVELVDGQPTVLNITRGSPAEKAGVQPSDRILRLDDAPVAGLTAKAVMLRLAGEKGSRVRVALERGSRLDPDSLTLTLRRAFPKPGSSVDLARTIGGTVGYVRLGEFGVNAARDVRDAIKRLQRQGATHLILDLRGNPGGSVIEAVDLAAEFLPANALVFTTKGRKKAVNEEFRTKSAGDFRELPLVVLIDEGSASAAEALAGTLQDHDRALIMGRRSFGKALMQTPFLVPSGVVMLTVGHIVSPSGRFIQRRYEGLAVEQYYAFAGDSAWQDTTKEYRTTGGRIVRGGGGIAPDVALPAPPPMPRWWSVAADSGYDDAVADSVAHTLATDAAARGAWMTDAARWDASLLQPFLSRVRTRLGVAATPDSRLAGTMARHLAARAAYVRWPEDEAGAELRIRNDPDIIAAVQHLPRIGALLQRRP